MGPGRFGAVLCAMATPFDPDGRLDLDGAATLARWLVDSGNDGLVVTGTTGESPVLSDEEKVELWRAVRAAVTVPVIAGTSTADTAHSVKLTRAASAAGVDGILAVTPYYSRPSQAGIEAHVRAIAGASDLPVVLYDIPVRTGRKVAESTIVRLVADGAIVGVKDAAANPAGSAALVAAAPPGFELYSGNDSDTLPLLAVGAVGVISVESHWAAPEVGDMVSAFWKGDVEAARTANARLLDSHRFQSSDEAPNPVPTKAMLKVLGLPGGQCRPPMGPPPDGLDQRARQVLSQLHG
ncbi:MAG TPA: 4-hydroxy-tetrahydrodipicolinate synthase [Acidimicrobiales bacterium]|jgi:4-hydroxy-tetrahydrodipicolinate synthase|nr:4-hydroxy-tetrahydrodipicolinate synthase [Acidimicrobiales bacterium]